MMMPLPYLRIVLKSALLIPYLVYGLGLAVWVCIVGDGSRRRRERLAQQWHRGLLRLLGIRMQVRGTRAIGPHLIVANHVSWLDIPAIGAVEKTRFVSKIEVRDWPIAGWLVRAAGTFYLQRGAGGTKTLIGDLARFAQAGGVTTFFPEGTTTTGESTLRFQPRLFGAAIESGCMIQPVALRYGRAQNGDNVAAFVGDDDLVSNLLRLMREPALDIEVTFCPPLQPEGRDRAQLAEAAQAAIRRVIAPAAPRSDLAGSAALAA
jgi:1-acyl-sn-glycerol-3-phosphate acyltransferase